MATPSTSDASILKVIRVFLASPSDLADERRTARAAVDEINKTVARPAGFHVDLIGWEDTLSSAGRPQALINEDLETCQVFIGMLWARWGTPPDSEGLYTSGFEEEFSLACARHLEGGEPHITLFFKDVEQSKLNDPGPELSKVIAFKDRMITEKKVLFDAFTTAGEFGQKVRLTIASFIHKVASLASSETQATLSEGQTTATDAPSSGDTSGSPTGPSADEVAFLGTITTAVETQNEASLTVAQIARFRNIGAVFGRGGNDDISVGPHDANLIFRSRHEFRLSPRETSALADAGLEAWSAENKPVWSWLSDRLDAFPGWLGYSTALGPDARRIGAFRAMGAINSPLIEDDFLNSSGLRELWFGDSVSDQVKNAALEYIGKSGTPALRPLVEAELSRNSYATRRNALEAAIQSLARESVRSAAQYAIESSFDILNDSTLALVLSGLKELDDGPLIVALDHRAGPIRAEAIRLLMARDRLTETQIRRFFGDDSIEARRAAVAAYDMKVGPLSDDEAKEALVLSKPKSGLASSGSNYDHAGDSALAEYKLNKISKLPLGDLQEATKVDVISADDYYFASAMGHFLHVADKLRSDVDDGFKSYWSQHLEDLRLKYKDSGGDTFVDIFRKHETFRRRQFMRKALDILVSGSDPGDLARLRRAIDEDAVDPRAADIDYLHKWGTWEDIERISKIASDYRSSGAVTLLTASLDVERPALAIMKLAADRMSEIFALNISTGIKTEIISKMPMAAFRRLGQTIIESLLSDSTDTIRKAASLQILQSFGRKDAQEYLHRYLNLPYVYYNVIFWLDLCEAWNREFYRPIARRHLQIAP